MLLRIIRKAGPSDPLYRRPSDPNRGIGSNLSFFHRMGWGGGRSRRGRLAVVTLVTSTHPTTGISHASRGLLPHLDPPLGAVLCHLPAASA